METSFSDPYGMVFVESRTDTRTINQVAKDEELRAAYQRIAELTAELVECRDYFDNRADISNEHDEDGSPRPNEEMRRLVSIDECLHGKGYF